VNLKTEITKLHYTEAPKGFIYRLLQLCSLFFAFGTKFKNFLYDKKFLKAKKVDALVVSVGNFTTGGVGKTPVVYEIAKYLRDKDKKVAIISRGYGGKLSNKDVHVISDGINLYYTAEMAGDEPYWLAVSLNMCAVLTCSDRYKAAKYAVEKMGITHIILDDGFQHRKFYRDLDIVLVDSEKMFGNENLLPAGPLREGVEAFKRVDKLVIMSKNTDHSRAEKLAKIVKKKQSVDTYICKLEPDYVYNIMSGQHLDKTAEITAVSAIGQPEQFYAFLEKDYKIKNIITFDDHHQYTQADIEGIEGAIVTTEKDAVKLAVFKNTEIYALKLKADFDCESIIKK